MSTASAAVSPRRRSPFARQEALYGYLFLAPWLIGLVVFVLGPMLVSFGLSLTVYGIVKPPEYIGFDNFTRMFTNDPQFWPSVGKTLTWAILYVPLAIFGALLVAMLLNQGLKLTNIYRTGFFLPHLFPTVASIYIWTWLLHPKFGFVNETIWQMTYRLTGSGIEGPAWLNSKEWVIPSLIMIALWGAIGGNGMMIFLAGLQGVPKELYEVAELDGANVIQRFVNITLPMISPTLFFNLVLGLIGALQAFENAFVATGGGPAYAAYFYALHIYTTAFKFGEYGYGAALAVVSFFALVTLTYFNFRLSKRWVYYAGEVKE
jgi:multiple sugar transport system permease protein